MVRSIKESANVQVDRIKTLLESDPQEFDKFRSVHPDCNPLLSARFYQSIFRPEQKITTLRSTQRQRQQQSKQQTALEKEWNTEAVKWPRKWFQFFRRDTCFTIQNPRDEGETLKTSLGQANFLLWVVADPMRLQQVMGKVAERQQDMISRRSKPTLNPVKKGPKMKRPKKIASRQEKRAKAPKVPAMKKQATRPLKKQPPPTIKSKKISDALDDDIKPRLSSKVRSRQSPTYCTYNATWMEIKRKDPTQKIRIIY